MRQGTIKLEKQYLAWLQSHRKKLQKYSGQWIGISLRNGVVAAGKNLKMVDEIFRKKNPREKPHLFQVPPRGEKFYILRIL